jgi:hypothetical protein
LIPASWLAGISLYSTIGWGRVNQAGMNCNPPDLSLPSS